MYIEDSDGHRMLDGMSGLWCCGLGYSQASIVEAITAQLQTLPYYNNFFQCANAPAVVCGTRYFLDVTPDQVVDIVKFLEKNPHPESEVV